MREDIERSLQTKYRKDIWTRFVTAVKRYKLINEGDNVAACVSGGKDSFLLAALLRLLRRYSDIPFGLKFLCMDPGYAPENLAKIRENAARLELDVTYFETDIFAAAANTDKNPCYLCARMRRGYLYRNALDMGCNKIALGHHFSDVTETTLMGLLWGAQFQAMMPKLKSANFPGAELIRPLYLVHEDAIIAWKNYNKLEFIQCACRFTENCGDCGGGVPSKRLETKALIKRLKRDNPNVEQHIFKATCGVNLNTLLGWKKDGEEHNFVDEY